MGNISIDSLIARMITLVIAFTIHEYSHAFAAVKLGDNTPRIEGRLTLNPLAHLDVLGTLMLLLQGFGWAKPVHVNPSAVNKKTKAGMAIVSFCGPFSNFLLAVIAALVLRTGIVPSQWNSNGVFPSLFYFLHVFILVNLNLLIFNLLPFSPLDGEKVAEYVVPNRLKSGWNAIQHYGPFILLILFFILPYLRIDIFGKILSPIVNFLYQILVGGF